MESAHHRQMRYYQGLHGYYSQYRPEASSWSLWPEHPPPPPTQHHRPHRWCNVLAAAITFLIILAIMIIAGLAIYMGALKLEMSPYLVLDGSFRVVVGDSYNASLSDTSSDLYQRKAQFYKLLIESIMRRSDLAHAVKQCSVLGFTNGSLVVFFRLMLDRRKIPKKAVNIEERIRDILLQEISAASPLKRIKIDNTHVFLKRLGDDSNQAAHLEELESSKNQSIEVHNGLLRKAPPKIITSYYTRSPSDKTQLSKSSTTRDDIIEGSFVLSTSELPSKDHTTNPPHYSSEYVSHKTTSSHEYQTHQTVNGSLKTSPGTDSASSIDFYQHSPALNALLSQKQKLESATTTTLKPTEQILTDLITLLPYAFQEEEEPWKPILPENFTRNPERRPLVTEDYNSQGIGVVEVVLDPEDISSSVPLQPVWSNEDVSLNNQEDLNIENPVDVSKLLPLNFPKNQLKDEKEAFQPRSDDKVTFLLNTAPEKTDESLYRVHGDIVAKNKNNKLLRINDSLTIDNLPDIPIVQQFHDLDTFLRSYSFKASNSKLSDIPVTLLPARSNLDIRKQIRPRPQLQRGSYVKVDSTKNSETTKDAIKVVKSHITLEVFPTDKEQNSTGIESAIETNPVALLQEDSDTADVENIDLETQTPDPLLSTENYQDDYYQDDSKTSLELTDNLSTTLLEYQNYVNNVETTSSGGGNSKQFELGDEAFDPTTESELSAPLTMSSRNNRKSKMTENFHKEEIPLKIDLQDTNNRNLLRSPASTSQGINVVSDKKTCNQSQPVVKLKDTKMQSLLEQMLLYNLTTETPGTISQTEYINSFLDIVKQNDSSNEVNVAQNRKYGQSSEDSKNSLVRNSTYLEMKPEMLYYYLKRPKNESAQGGSYSNSLNKNNNFEEVNKSISANYVLNKDGFLMLTKVYNKVPANAQTASGNTAKPNRTENQPSECVGSMSTRCGSGECINTLSRCDHLVNCADGSDERNCTCAEFLRAQYLTSKICDGVVDCWDFSDETNCEWCSIGQYVCSNSRVCIDRIQVCDGEPDCPNGDDEKNCVSIAPNLSQADSMEYHSSGILMIRKEGDWGKLCTQNFESLSSIFKSKWTLEDLGKVVCKKMTFRNLERVEHINDTSNRELRSNTFFELSHSTEAVHHSRSGLTFGNTDCPEKKVVRITCADLECGVRPQAKPQWRRTKRVSGTRRSRIVGGGNADPGSWPWLAALYKEGEFQCGGTLIADQWLLSAGHCFYRALDEFWVARLGALRRRTNLPSPYEQLRVISRILLHPNYVDSGFINDISLLQMEKPVSFTNYVRPICLPQPSAVLRDGKMCTVIGWGQLFEVGRIFPDTLQEVQLPVISTSECRKRTLFLSLYKVTENMFCAGYDRGGRDACLGDSGGPLMCQETDGHWSLMGVTSNGYGCARANRPGVYTKVANYVNWVHSSMASSSGSSQMRNVTCHGHRCPLGECLLPAHICNGFVECSDGSDERNCSRGPHSTK